MKKHTMKSMREKRSSHRHSTTRMNPSRKMQMETLENRCLLAADLILGAPPLENVTNLDLVDVSYSRMFFNRRTGQTTLDAIVSNTSSDSMPGQAYLVVDAISPASASILNADGFTLDGRPYYQLNPSQDDLTDAFSPGDAFASEGLVISGTGGKRLNIQASVHVVPAVLTFDQGVDDLSFNVGDSGYVAFGVSTLQIDGFEANIEFEQSVLGEEGGILLNSDFPGGWTNLDDTTRIVNEFIDGLTPGVYTVVSTASLPELGISETRELTINVIDPGANVALLWEPGADPDGLQLNTTTEVKFSALVTGTSTVSELTLTEVDENGNPVQILGNLRDDGLNGDFLAGDGVYAGTFSITTTVEGTLYFQSSFSLGSQLFTSPQTTIEVTPFPSVIAESDQSKIVFDPNSGIEIFSNEVLVSIPETSSSRIIEIVSSIGGTVVGSIPSFSLFQVRIDGDDTYQGVYDAIEALSEYAEVLFAEPNYVGSLSAVSPDSSNQYGPVTIRADEAWVVSGSSMIVAVVDTGVDYNHPDLSGVVIKGRDYVNNDTDPMDDHGHGTHVAGIIAAKHNGSGISGVAHGSKILAVKSASASGSVSWAALASGVRYAADNGAKIINVSLAFSAPSFLGKAAVDYAASKGALVIGAAGNHGASSLIYPAAYPSVVAVGNTTSADTRNPSSGFGSWVDIAAPGTGIYSTMLGNTYGNMTGTSQATPHVAGAAAVLWSQNPGWTAAQVRQRLEQTAAPLPAAAQLGAGRLDLFEAVFNGSFEIGVNEWQTTGTASSLTVLGPIVPQHRENMGYASTGPAGDQVAATIEKTFTIQPGVTSLPIEFVYTFVTEEFPEFVGTQFDDSLRVVLISGGSETVLAVESVNASSYSAIGGIDFPGGDDTVGWTGWKTASTTVSVTPGSSYTLRFEVEDAGDDIYDSVLLVDRIRLKTGSPLPAGIPSFPVIFASPLALLTSSYLPTEKPAALRDASALPTPEAVDLVFSDTQPIAELDSSKRRRSVAILESQRDAEDELGHDLEFDFGSGLS